MLMTSPIINREQLSAFVRRHDQRTRPTCTCALSSVSTAVAAAADADAVLTADAVLSR